MSEQAQIRALYGVGCDPLLIATALAVPWPRVMRALLADATPKDFLALIAALDRSVSETAPLLEGVR